MGTFKGFICDKCGKEFRATEKDYCPVNIHLSLNFGSTNQSLCPSKSVIWCRGCVMSTGFYAPFTDEDKKIAPANQLSFEEKFAELIYDMGFVRE